MPELPEVEVVRRGLQQSVLGRTVGRPVVRESRLRWPVPRELPQLLEGRTVRSVERRGKYLLLGFDHGVLIVHLGMSGSLRFLSLPPPASRHDHVDLPFGHGTLRFHDPRRFGAMLWHEAGLGPVQAHRLLEGLGVEPLGEAFDGALLHRATRGRRVAIKQALLSGRIVVGVGNIYASESLFRAGIRPGTPAHRLGRERCERLAAAIRSTLVDAIRRGGSSLRDFVASDGASGHFQLDCFVYGRAGQPCRVCATPVRGVRQGQRSTFYCPRCQR